MCIASFMFRKSLNCDKSFLFFPWREKSVLALYYKVKSKWLFGTSDGPFSSPQSKFAYSTQGINLVQTLSSDGVNMTSQITACRPQPNVNHPSPKMVLTAKYRSQFSLQRIHYFRIINGKIDCLIFASLCFIFCLQNGQFQYEGCWQNWEIWSSVNDYSGSWPKRINWLLSTVIILVYQRCL